MQVKADHQEERLLSINRKLRQREKEVAGQNQQLHHGAVRLQERQLLLRESLLPIIKQVNLQLKEGLQKHPAGADKFPANNRYPLRIAKRIFLF